MKYILLLTLLFFPLKYFLVYHLVLVLVSFLLLYKHRYFQLSIGVYATLVLMVFIFTGSLIRTFFFDFANPRDYMEIFRFVPIILFLMLNDKLAMEEKSLRKLFLTYIIIDIVVSVAQLLELGIVSPISKIYASEIHASESLELSFRALGLSSGPGQHATIMIIFYIYFLVDLLKQNKWSNFFGVLLPAVAIILAQSQSVFIVMILSTVFILFYNIFFGSSRQKAKAVKIFIWFTSLGAIFVLYFLQNLRYLFTLITEGTERSSFQKRLEKANDIYEMMLRKPYFIITGYGKDYFGTVSGAMDNEYLYILAVYGVFVFVAFFSVLSIMFFRGLFTKERVYRQSISFLLFAGFIIAYPISFFTDPRVVLLLIILAVSSKHAYFKQLQDQPSLVI